MNVHSDKRTQRLRAMLLLVIGEAQRQMRSIRIGIRSGAGDRRAVGDLTDDITREVDLAAVTAQSSALQTRLSAAQEALRRLESGEGTYGFCDDCGGTISESRLQALPFAKRCIGCQEGVESSAPLSRRQVGARFTP